MAMSVYYEGPLLVEEDYDLISSFQELSDYKTPKPQNPKTPKPRENVVIVMNLESVI